MPKLSSAQKVARASERKRLVNQPVKSGIKNLVSRSEAAMKAGNQAEAAESVKKAIVALDRAVPRGVLHANNAARRKSRLAKKFNAALKAAAAAPTEAAKA